MSAPEAAPLRSAIYGGVVTHARRDGPRHGFRYPLYLLLLDLDELPRLDRELRLLSVERPGVVSFRERDHLSGTARPLRAQVEDLLRAEGIAPPGGRIELLTHARVLGYVFNPVSIFWCYDREGALRACVAEVNNTFGDRHPYVLSVGTGGGTTWEHKKLMHVSPFFAPNAGTYRFTLPAPGATARLAVDLAHGGRNVLEAALELTRRELTDRSLLRALLRWPLVTLKVTAAIHLEALRLWIKGAPVFTRPPYDPAAAQGGPA